MSHPFAASPVRLSVTMGMLSGSMGMTQDFFRFAVALGKLDSATSIMVCTSMAALSMSAP